MERQDAHALPDLQVIIGLFMSIHAYMILHDRETARFHLFRLQCLKRYFILHS